MTTKQLVSRRPDKLEMVRRAKAAEVKLSPRKPGDRLGTVKVIAASRGNGR